MPHVQICFRRHMELCDRLQVFQVLKEPCITSKHTRVSGFAAKVSELLQDFPLDVSVWVKMSKSGLRYFTFSMLDLRHTCCNIYAIGGPTLFYFGRS